MITMTPTAEQKIRELMQEEKETVGLRVFVKGGGCHGYQYGMAFESQVGEDDTVIERATSKSSWIRKALRCWPAAKSIFKTPCKGPALPSRTRKRKPRVDAAVLSAHNSLVATKTASPAVCRVDCASGSAISSRMSS